MDKEKFFVDKYLSCVECQTEFAWLGKDQKFLQECIDNKTPNPFNGSVITEMKPPRRCFACRKKRKAYFEGLKKID